MQNLFILDDTVLVIFSILVLLMSFVPVTKIIKQLPDRKLSIRWMILACFIFVLIVGCFSYILFHNPYRLDILSVFLAPGIFFCGAVFIFLVCDLSLRTTIDLQQMYIFEQESITDPLTGMYNRRYLDKRIIEEFQRAMRSEQPFSVFLLDIDYFKKVNDTYGHQTGDKVLKKLGQLILKSVREVDIAIRYGGEEILVILPMTTERNAFDLAERLRRQIEYTRMVEPDPQAGHPAVYITASFGVSEYLFSDGWDNAQKVIERADKSLFQAKDRGRNRVICSNLQNCEYKQMSLF